MISLPRCPWEPNVVIMAAVWSMRVMNCTVRKEERRLNARTIQSR